MRSDGFSCQELVMRLKTEAQVDANGCAVVFIDIQDNERELLLELGTKVEALCVEISG